MSLVIVVNKIIKALKVPPYPVCVSVNVSAILSMFDLELQNGKSTLMTFFFSLLLERHDQDTDTSDSMAIQQLTDAEVEESEEGDEEEGQGGEEEKMTESVDQLLEQQVSL